MVRKPKNSAACAADPAIGVQAVASGTAKSGQLHPTVEHVLLCAKQVLVEHGHAGFTTRLVAEKAGISPGNLTYHFPSKTALLQAVIRRLVEDYSSQFEKFLANSDIPPSQELPTLVNWLLTDAVAEESVRTFRELWAMSLHDEVIRRAVDDLYDHLMDGVVQLLKRSHPNADVTSIRELVQMLALISEGSIVLYGTAQRRAVPLGRIIKLVTPLLGSIAPGVQISGTPEKQSPGKAKRR